MDPGGSRWTQVDPGGPWWTPLKAFINAQISRPAERLMPSKVGSTKWRIFWSEIVSGGERSLYCWQRVVMHERYGKSKYDFVPFFICTSSQFLRHTAVTIISGSVCGQPWHWPVIGWRVWIYNISHRKWFWWISSMFSILNLKTLNAANPRTFLSTPAARPITRRLC